MSERPIKKYPDRLLRKRCHLVKGFTEEVKTLSADMATTMYVVGGVGLSAPQIGVSKQLIVVDTGEGLIKMANPKILIKKGARHMEEGCLSVPEKVVRVPRAEEILVSYIDESGKECTKTFRGLTARTIQHEVDHINGRLIIDYLPWYRRILRK